MGDDFCGVLRQLLVFLFQLPTLFRIYTLEFRVRCSFPDAWVRKKMVDATVRSGTANPSGTDDAGDLF